MLITRKLKRYSKKFNKSLTNNYLSLYDSNPDMREILKYTLDGGKRMRPAIIYDILKTLNNDIDGSNIAITIELIHTSSLIIDDLPCMDNDDIRRGKESLHKHYGLLTAKIASTVLISDAHMMLFKMYDTVSDQYTTDDLENRILYILENITTNIGIDGAAYGQYLDMIPKYSDEFVEDVLNNEIKNYNREDSIQEIVEKKTGVIFEIAFVSSYIIGGGDIKKIDDVKLASHYFGTIFQIYDDFMDEELDKSRMVNGLTPNYVIRFGRDHSIDVMKKTITEFKTIMTRLGLYSKFFSEMILYIFKKTRMSYK